VSHAFDNHFFALHAKLDPIVAGPDSVMAGQIAPQRLRAAYLGPILKPANDGRYPGLDTLGKR